MWKCVLALPIVLLSVRCWIFLWRMLGHQKLKFFVDVVPFRECLQIKRKLGHSRNV